MRVDRHVVPAADIFLKVTGELPREVLRHVIDGLAPVTARQRRAHLAGTRGKDGGDALVLCRRPQHRLAQS
jgi:hypothetical protein